MKEKRDILRIGGPLLGTDMMSFEDGLTSAKKENISEARIEHAQKLSSETVVRRIIYRSNGHKVFGYIAEPRETKGNMPCIIWNRGGSNDFGAITDWQAFAILAMFASWGYIVIASQYSGNCDGEGKDEFGGKDLDDVLVLREVLRCHPHADLKRIGMHGGSRGGMMTYLCLAKVKWVRAAVTVAGLADLERNAKKRPEMRVNFKKMFGGSKKELVARSAVKWADKFCATTPLLMLHGTNDWRVSPQDSLDLSSELLKTGIHHSLVLFEGDDHFLSANRKRRWELTRTWFERYLTRGERIQLQVGK